MPAPGYIALLGRSHKPYWLPGPSYRWIMIPFMSRDQTHFFLKTVTLKFVSFLKTPASHQPSFRWKIEIIPCEFSALQLKIPLLPHACSLSFLFSAPCSAAPLLCQGALITSSPASTGICPHSLFPVCLGSSKISSNFEPCPLPINIV